MHFLYCKKHAATLKLSFMIYKYSIRYIAHVYGDVGSIAAKNTYVVRFVR